MNAAPRWLWSGLPVLIPAFVGSAIASCVYAGKAYGIPGALDYDFLLYSKDVYRAAGLDPEKPPATYSEWVAHSEKIYQLDSQGNVTRMGMDPRGGGLDRTGYNFGGQFYDANNLKITCNQGGVVEALSWEVENAKRWNPEKVAGFTSGMPNYAQPNSGFGAGKQAYLYPGGALWAYEPLDQYAPNLDYGAGYIPTPDGTPEERKRYYYFVGWEWSIAKGAKQPDGAWSFMKYAFYDKAARMGVITLNGCAVISQVDEWLSGMVDHMGKDNRMAKYMPIIGESAKAATNSWPAVPVSSRYLDEVLRAEDYAVRMQKTAQQALDECATIVQGELDKALQG